MRSEMNRQTSGCIRLVSSMKTLFTGLGFGTSLPTSLSATEVVMSE